MEELKTGYVQAALQGLQHVFAMFGATILVPLLTGLSVQVTLVAVGIGTLLFHFFAKGRVPAFLGSSFAFLVGIRLITDPAGGLFAGTGMAQAEKLAYATGGIFVAGFVYLLFALIVYLVGVKKFMEWLPPIVTAPTVILIGIMLAPFAISQSRNNLLLAVVTLFIVIVAASWGRGMVKIMPILLGIGGAYALALVMQFAGMTNPNGTPVIDFGRAVGAGFVGLPPFMAPRFNILAILLMIPFSFATIAEHVGDIVALSTITGEDFLENPGLSRTLIGDGIATSFAGLIGGPANVTYGENIGVVALTRMHNPRIVQLAAVYAVVLGLSPIFAALIYTIPEAIVGGASFMLYGMIAAVGIRNLVDSKVDMSETRNLTVVAVMLVTGLGFRFGPAITFPLGGVQVPVDRLGLFFAVVLGVVLNLVLPKPGATEVLPKPAAERTTSYV